MKVKLCSILVDDQAKALSFYTDKLGFIKKADLPMGEYRWLTVVSANDPEGAELCLEPNVYPAAASYQAALHEAGIPITALASEDVRKEHEQLVKKGVKFTAEPAEAGGTVLAVFEDTCGNLIQMFEL